jgi:hypothetical protein
MQRLESQPTCLTIVSTELGIILCILLVEGRELGNVDPYTDADIHIQEQNTDNTSDIIVKHILLVLSRLGYGQKAMGNHPKNWGLEC